ncbi:MAG: tRNA (adenosine(37)-N6)-threonylcarbamoyltransferase complex ATPase subunit type 1 TsaE [Leptolyngbyaceae cyanobacterium bins.302]|nr:tRNA (adenosine(37)-N6)-threonylcarbamoyltransferase complex ATPase subunit type 1 TsaE [Leptolyngbyaceae cyanobacterium bins.302]
MPNLSAQSSLQFPYTLALANATATRQFGIELGKVLPPGSVLLLEGDLGSGKTTLVQGIGEGLGIAEPIDSPTFTLINEYLEGRSPLYHLDLYRLNTAEVTDLTLDIYWDEAEVEPGIVAIEWAERLHHKPLDYLQIQLTYVEPEGRQAILLPVGEFDPKPLFALIQK